MIETWLPKLDRRDAYASISSRNANQSVKRVGRIPARPVVETKIGGRRKTVIDGAAE